MPVQKQELLEYWKVNKFPWDKDVLEAFTEIPREEFVLNELKPYAYEDRPLPLMRNKTISQPTTVLIMTQALELKAGDKVFEVGTGSGYQSAVIARIVGEKGRVITTEIMPELVQFSRENLKRLKIDNVTVYEMDGSQGLPEEAPFDKIIITAAAKEFPKPLVDQLKEKGIIIAPIGMQENQQMIKAVKEYGRLTFEPLGSFLFTPLIGKYGWEE